MHRALRLPAGSDQRHNARVLAGEIFCSHGPGAGDAKLLQKYVMDYCQ